MLKGYLVPHPPLIVKGIGNGSEIPKTRAAYQKIAEEIKKENPETVIIISPHSQIYTDYFHVSPGKFASGDFGNFNAPDIKFSVEYDEKLADLIGGIATESGIPAGGNGEINSNLDHGTMVPLYFLESKKIVRISISGMSFVSHYKFGMCIKQAIDRLNRKAVIIASGDMSHKLKTDGPYGLAKEGAVHDEFVKTCLEKSDFKKLMNISPEIAEKAAECGLRSIMVLIGVMDKINLKSEILNYEAPYGVGYLTASFIGNGETKSLLTQITSNQKDMFVQLAKENVENFIKTGKQIHLPSDLPNEMVRSRAGVFVSIKKNGQLRGCIGTITPTCENIANEILQNSISAAIHDPRFRPITPDELDNLTYSVDVLFPPEPIKDKSELNVLKYGVIVSCGNRSGLLLPNLKDVKTVDEQISIALQKGNISPDEPYTMKRFEVVRHK